MKRYFLTLLLAALVYGTAQAQQRALTAEQEQPLDADPQRPTDPVTASSSEPAQEQPSSGIKASTRNGVIEIEDTIRIKREQPKVLSIVPWQPPRDKASLPSPFVKRIEQDFMPLDREEFTRKVQHFERVSGTEQK